MIANVRCGVSLLRCMAALGLARLRQTLAARSIVEVALRPLEPTGQAQLRSEKRTGTALRPVLTGRVNFAGLAGAGGPKTRRVTRRYWGDLLAIADRDLLLPKIVGVVLGGATLVASCNSSDCELNCPAGTTLDSIGCGCVQGGAVCDGGASEIQDAAARLGDCCPPNVLQSTLRVAPSGMCTGTLSCFVAVHQMCLSAEESGPVDEYQCTCAAGAWQCSLASEGTGTCSMVGPDAASD